jgi:hypothetical protein
MRMGFTKDESILDLLSTLQMAERSWEVVDHWEGDRCAIGIGRKDHSQRLVYISTYDKGLGRYDFECEVQHGDAPDSYSVVEHGGDVGYDALLDAIKKHLS